MPKTLLIMAVLSSSVGASEPGVEWSSQSGPGDWATLIGALARKGDVVAPFTEERYFPFRRDPTVLSGFMRISPEHGLSLEYTGPESSILIADEDGIIMRQPNGRERAVSSASRQSGAVSSLLPILRFDLGALYPKFSIRAFHEEGGWRLEFTPKDPDVADSLGVITVAGTGSEVRHLEFRRSSSQRVEIAVGHARAGIPFTPTEVKDYFR